MIALKQSWKKDKTELIMLALVYVGDAVQWKFGAVGISVGGETVWLCPFGKNRELLRGIQVTTLEKRREHSKLQDDDEFMKRGLRM